VPQLCTQRETVMNYTKGEWEALPWNVGHGFNVFAQNTFIAKVPLDTAPHTMNETRDNANLIAAAPDMYETLKTIQKWLLDDEQIIEGSQLYNQMFVKANNLTIKALSKAEGKS